MSTAFYSHPECRLHDMGAGHPECPQRLDAITDHLRGTGLDIALQFHDAPLVTLQQLSRAHASGYVAEVMDLMQRVCDAAEPRAVDPDTVVGVGTLQAALRSAGAAVAATDEVLAGRAANAFCAVRPPGHHATRDQAMGFCFFNNVAVAARHALDVHGLQRVAIIDFDVHHGNGTEDIIAGDERVLMCSIFQHPFYPYSGAEKPAANMCNVPLAAGCGGEEFRDAVTQVWMPRLKEFKPQMIFISAGFDAHVEDDMAGLAFVESDYAWVTQLIKSFADQVCEGRIVSILEGGYNLSALGRSAEAHVRVLAELNR